MKRIKENKTFLIISFQFRFVNLKNEKQNERK